MSGMPFLVYYSSEVKNMKPTAAKTVSSQLIYRNHGRKAASFFILLILACAATCASAETYYWKATSASEPASGSLWTALSNWSTESESGADASSSPGSSDTIYALGNRVWRVFNLDGNEYTIDGWDSNGDWNRKYWRFSNGTLHWAGNHTTHSDTVYLESGMSFIFDEGSYYLASDGHGAADEWFVGSDTSLSMFGELRVYNLHVEIASGGMMTFNPTALKFWDSPAQASYIKNNGTLVIDNGYSFSIGSANASFSLQQLGGILTLGGPLSKNGMAGTYEAIFSGGTVRVTGDVSFDLTSVTIPADAALTLEIDENASIDLSTVI